MICEVCRGKEAEVLLFLWGKEKRLRLIPVCGICSENYPSLAKFNLALPDRTVICEVCGFSFSQFLQTGRLGCPQCYNSFSQFLIPLINYLQR
ncbi:hypothetical protein H5T87_05595 [bacterium]|nr:hypothetical protein [bacterium]